MGDTVELDTSASSVLALVDQLEILLSELYARWSNVREKYDIGPRGVGIVRRIADGQIYPSIIAQSISTGRSVVTYELRRLEAADLIVQRQATHDGRRIKLSLTTTGKAMLRELDALHQELFGPLLRKYPPERMDELLKILGELSACVARPQVGIGWR